MVTPIFICSWNRRHFTEECLKLIRERTAPGSYEIHVYDNGSDKGVREWLYEQLDQGLITSLVLDSRNTGCVYNKGVFHMMAGSDSPYYVVSDNDVYPPLLTPDWLTQMTTIMDNRQDIAFLAPQLPPQFLQEPDKSRVYEDVVYCKAVGNTFKMVRRSAFPIESFKPKIGAYGDDGMVCAEVLKKGFQTAFCTRIFCFHAGQCDNWGYQPEQVAQDPRKGGYGKPFTYPILSQYTYEPTHLHRMDFDSKPMQSKWIN